jgi:hypothetical protein
LSRLHHVYFNTTSTSRPLGNPPASRLPATKVTTSAYIQVDLDESIFSTFFANEFEMFSKLDFFFTLAQILSSSNQFVLFVCCKKADSTSLNEHGFKPVTKEQ